VPITVQVTAPVARALRGLDAPSAASRALADRAAALGVTLRPQHARATDAPLVGFFAAAVRDAARVEATLALLRDDPSVEGAWQTPDDQLPE
jgi:hypothetical protein